MARIPFNRMPHKQQVAVIMSLQKKGLWTFKPLEKFKNFSKWVRDFHRKDWMLDDRAMISTGRGKEGGLLGAHPLYGDLRDITPKSVVKRVDGYFNQWWSNPVSRGGRTLMAGVKEGIRNPNKFGKVEPWYGENILVHPEDVEYLAKIRAINRTLLKEVWGPERMTLYRGVHGRQADKLARFYGKRITVDHHFLTSYTDDFETALAFSPLTYSRPGYLVLEANLPIERAAFSYWVAGAAEDTEYIIFGGKFPVRVLDLRP